MRIATQLIENIPASRSLARSTIPQRSQDELCALGALRFMCRKRAFEATKQPMQWSEEQTAERQETQNEENET